MTVKQKTRVISVYLSVKRQNKWINKAESNLKSDFCSLCMWARCCFYLKVTCCYVIIMWPPVPWQAIPFYLSLHYWGVSFDVIIFYLFSYFLPWYCTWPSHGLSRSSHKCSLLSGWQRRACQKAWWAADKHTYRRWHLLRRSPSEIVQILHIEAVTIYI